MSADSPPATLTQIKIALRSATSGISSLDGSLIAMAHDKDELKQLLKVFTSNPSVSKYTTNSSHYPLAQTNEINEIKSNLTALLKTVNSLHQKVSTPHKQAPHAPPKVKGADKTSPPTYAHVASGRSTRASLMMNLKGLDFSMDCRLPPVYFTNIFNDALKASPLHQVHVAATRWTAKGNLVITGGHLNTVQQLHDCTEILAKALTEDQSVPDNAPLPHPPTRPNIKWSKLLINGIPTGVQVARDQAYSPKECHEALVNENPAYAALLVTQKPSWVRPPHLYTDGSSSSLVMAFEDQDGSKAKTLLADRHLYAFGVRASVKRWKQHPPKHRLPPPTPTAMMPTSQYTSATLAMDSLIEDLSAQSPPPLLPPLLSPEAPAPACSPQKHKALVLSPPNRATSSTHQPSKRIATRPPNTWMDEDHT
jgi:hypothetical protein